MPKRKRVVLTIEQKVEIVKALKRGESCHSLSEKYGIGISTVSEIGKKAAIILDYSTKLLGDGGNSMRKIMSKSKNEEVMEAVYVWFTQKRGANVPVTGHVLCEKALSFNVKLNGDPDFKASQGWLEKFKKRHGIRSLQMHGEKLSADTSSANSFKEELKMFLEQEQYDEDFVYSADETGLHWKALPTKTLVTHVEDSAAGFKAVKDRVTLMVCANSSGTHRLPLFLIGKYRSPRALKNAKKIPVVYAHQRKAWMNVDTFVQWFEKVFVPEVKRYQISTGKTGKVLLLIDNAPAHPSPERLNLINALVTVKFLPPNVTSLIQPMDQGVIQSLKRNYRKRLLDHVLLSDNGASLSISEFCKKINLKDCCFLVAESWETLKQSTLRSAWNQILIGRRTVATSVCSDADKDIEEIIHALKSLSFCNECTEPDVLRWLTSDCHEQGFQVMSDDEIIEFVSKQPANNEEEQYDDEDEVEQTVVVSHHQAFVCLETALKWFEEQEECDIKSLLCLKNIRDLAASKRRSVFKQTLITNFLK